MRERGKRYLPVLAMATALVMALTLACGGGKQAPPVPVPSGVQYGGTLRHALNMTMASMDPAFDREAPEVVTNYLLYNQLVALDPQLNVIPELAESWTVSSDGKAITFKIRKDVKFHDGTDLNAASIKWSLDRCLDPDVPCSSRNKIEQISSISAPDDTTLVLNLAQPWRPIMAALAEIAGFVPSRDAVEKNNSYSDQNGAFGRNPVGSGPFKFESWIPDTRVVFKKNGDYWEDGKPFLDEIVLQHIPDAQAQLAMIRTGETDVIADLPGPQVTLVRNNPDVKIDEYESGRTYIIRLLSDVAPFNDRHLRRAVGFAIDRQTIIDAIYGGFGRPAYSMGGVGWAYNPNIRPIAYDPEKAKQELAQSNYNRNTTKINYRCSSATQATSLCEAIQAQLQDAGISVDINLVTPQDFFTGVREGNYSMSDGFRTPLGDPHLLVSELYREKGRGNYTGYSNPEIDRLLDQAGGIFDTAQARAIYDQVKTIVAEDATTIYKMWSTEFTIMGTNVQNFIRTPDLDVRLRELWMTK